MSDQTLRAEILERFSRDSTPIPMLDEAYVGKACGKAVLAHIRSIFGDSRLAVSSAELDQMPDLLLCIPEQTFIYYLPGLMLTLLQSQDARVVDALLLRLARHEYGFLERVVKLLSGAPEFQARMPLAIDRDEAGLLYRVLKQIRLKGHVTNVRRLDEVLEILKSVS